MADIPRILTLLTEEYGEKRWRIRRDPVAVLVQTILSQNTSDINSGRAFQNLMDTFAGWDEVTDASISRICLVIKAGGLGKVKAGYIKKTLKEILRRRGEFSLVFLKDLSLNEAREWLMQLPGVGMKTASVVLLFSLGIPAVPVDTHVFRVASRLGLIGPKVNIEKAHRLLEAIVPESGAFRFHILLIEHGRRTCKSQRPRCTECVLGSLCPSYEKFVGQPWAGPAV